ncbi:MAG TPA: hypothetical protein VGG84_15185 [Gemmatimonadaceae bacterium]
MTRDELVAGVGAWRKTGYGIDPNQAALRHDDGYAGCGCMTCRPGLLPIVETAPGGRVEHYPTRELVTACRGW